ncbi:alpha/beta fold hydrolase [Methylobacterium sp. PvR107]|uniref:alpha/beta fold hydrolase n=1 Tax=Methylobacterium sp. PvR107 TaxID=2806597 RepID=UPI001B6A70FA|nr:alpha/beta hydrolase [Methylobacterium sp. PvR107]MBP1180913.1 pimeloyl-ACP methyl ester carboxylesterase [Methylobacterium sp. PvR107]
MTMNRRRVLTCLSALGIAAPLSRSFAETQPTQNPSNTYVLVHGAYGGGWIWRDVASELRRQGHQVWTPTQTGLGDRSHLLSREITVDTHVQDVANLIEMEDLHDIVLVGHSYGGMAVTGIADRMTDRISRIVYLDALIPENGDSAFALLPDGMANARRKAAFEQGAGVALPVPGPDAFPIPAGPSKDWFMQRLRPHPIGTYESPLRLSKPAGAGLPVTYVAYTNPALASIEPSRQRARSKAGWHYRELPVPHDVEVANPEKVVAVLLDRA